MKGARILLKICIICKETKGTDNFYRDSSRKSGYDNRCKTCEDKRKKLYIHKITNDKINTLGKPRQRRRPFPIDMPLIDRLMDSFLCMPSGCWDWQRSTSRGYGNMSYKGTHQAAYRFVYETFKSPIPKGMHLDHLCRNRLCVNFSHLEPVTAKENQHRGFGPAGINARKTHCLRGHEFNELNTYFRKTGRHCKICKKLRRKGLT